MDDLRAQLEALRARIRQIESARPESAPPEELPGAEVETTYGKHWETEVESSSHGDFRFAHLSDLAPDALTAISDGAISDVAAERIAFLDTETTGLAGGSGTLAFLIGIGRLDGERFRVRQFLIRDFAEEASALHAVATEMESCDLLVTYNGRAYDEPLLQSRYVLSRIPSPFGRVPHLDLLHGARRLWKMRFDSCRLVELEARILGYTRHGDVPGNLIPQIYFDSLRTGRPGRLAGILQHNALDILSLAALTAILPGKFTNRGSVSHAAEMVGLGRWLIASGQRDEAIPLFESAITTIEFDRLPAPRRRDVFVHLAKHHEHRTRNYARALEMALDAFALDEAEVLSRRVARLQQKVNQRRLNS